MYYNQNADVTGGSVDSLHFGLGMVGTGSTAIRFVSFHRSDRGGRNPFSFPGPGGLSSFYRSPGVRSSESVLGSEDTFRVSRGVLSRVGDKDQNVGFFFRFRGLLCLVVGVGGYVCVKMKGEAREVHPA